MNPAEADVLRELDFDVPCGAEAFCTNRVEWLWRCVRCEFTAPACSLHQQAFERLIASGQVAEVTCNGCRSNVITDYDWRPR